MGWTDWQSRPTKSHGWPGSAGPRAHRGHVPMGLHYSTPCCQLEWVSRLTGENTVLKQGTLEMQLLVPPCTAYVTSGKSLRLWGPDCSSRRLHQQPRKALAPPGPGHPEQNSMVRNPKGAHLSTQV